MTTATRVFILQPGLEGPLAPSRRMRNQPPAKGRPLSRSSMLLPRPLPAAPQCIFDSLRGDPKRLSRGGKRLSRGGGAARGIFGTCSGASGHGLSSCFDTYWPSKICGFRHWMCPRRVVTFLSVQSFRLDRPGRAAKLHPAQPASGQHAIRMPAATMPS